MKLCNKCGVKIHKDINTCRNCCNKEVERKKIEFESKDHPYMRYAGILLIIYAIFSFYLEYLEGEEYIYGIPKIGPSDLLATFLGGKLIYYLPGICLIHYSFPKTKKRKIRIRIFLITFLVLIFIWLNYSYLVNLLVL